MNMRDSAYAYSVAKIRAREIALLSSSDIEQLITAENLKAALRFLEEKGWGEAKNNEDIGNMIFLQSMQTWALLCDISPNREELDFLVVKNDYHNIKAILKAFVSDMKDRDYFITPSLVDPEMIKDAVKNKKYEQLPDFIRKALNEVYDVLIRTLDGQLSDIIIDRMALETIIEKAHSTKNEFIIGLAELMCVSANIKTSFRAGLAGKDEDFLKTALCDTKTLDKSALISAAIQGTDALTAFLSSTPYFKAAESLKISVTAFEKWCDDALMAHIRNAKYISLGVQPLIAYYLAKEAEIKNIRIILSCKHNNLPAEMIRERVRKLYV